MNSHRAPRTGFLDKVTDPTFVLESYVKYTCETKLGAEHFRHLEDPFDKGYLHDDSLPHDAFVWLHEWKSLATKHPDYPSSVDPEETARLEFARCEAKCKEVNVGFENSFSPTGDIGRIFHLAREKIRTILGPVPALDDLHLDFGRGATFDVRGVVDVAEKLRSRPSGTLDCLRALSSSSCLLGWRRYVESYQVVHGSELSFVPKNARTHRPICIEPTLNSMFQRGLGKHMKRRLLQAGCDLYSQDHNRRASSVGTTAGLATVDFSSASDLIAYQVVRYLLPWEWFEVLSTFRAERYLDGELWHEFEKFSSMGNGYTFELMSLIFLSLARASLEVSGLSDVLCSVFGDDVVIGTRALAAFQEAVTLLGFEVSDSKTFSKGRFRESCGLDTRDGKDVTPFRLKKRHDRVHLLFPLYNAIVRWGWRVSSGPETADMVEYVRHQIPPRLRLYGPDGRGDGALIASSTHAARRWNRRLQCNQYVFVEIQLRNVTRVVDHTMPYAIYSADSCDVGPDGRRIQASSGCAIRGRYRVTTKTIRTQEWVEPGGGMISSTR